MIRVIIFFAISLLAGEVVGQKNNFIDFSGLMQRTMIYNKDDYDGRGHVENITTYAPSYGFVFCQEIKSKIGIAYGVYASMQEQNFKIYALKNQDTEPNIDFRKRVLYAKLPVMLQGELISRPKNSVFISAGPQLGVMMSEDGIVPVYYGTEIGVPTDNASNIDIVEAAGAYKKFTFDVTGTIGWRTKVYKSIYFLVLCRADYTLTDVENKSFSSIVQGGLRQEVFHLYNKDRPATHNIGFGGGIGLSVKFR